MKAKPDCTGQRFGYLTVLGKSGRNAKGIQLWKLQCDCGKIIEKPRYDFDTNKNYSPSCGCKKILKMVERNQKRAKPDPTGLRFGMFVVLGKGGTRPDTRNSYVQLWKLRCDCGKVVERSRESFDRESLASCGCARRLGLIDNKRRPLEIKGQRFGNLTAAALTGKHDRNGKPTWIFMCDCGNTCELSLSRIRQKQTDCLWINCGDRSNHPERYLEYPPTPSPYPKAAGELLVKYLPLTELDYQQVDTAVEDEKRDRLIRAAWIIVYRRQQGEAISELHEARIIKKHLRYCSIDVFSRRKLESSGGFLYNASGIKKELGGTMTDTTLDNYPVIETQGINMMPTRAKHLKFKRC